MQLLAFDQNNSPIHAKDAASKLNYTCMECAAPVRIRGGPHRKYHFFHLQNKRCCKQNGKSLTHLEVQLHILRLLPEHDSQMEYPFPKIGRIADVVWHGEKLIFEVQCSPISSDEVLARNRDYLSEGYSVIWILLDRRFNKKRCCAAEVALQKAPHYFTNINSKGEGIIYDQIDLVLQAKRKIFLKELPIDLSQPVRPTPSSRLFKSTPLATRLTTRSVHFEGDLVTQVHDQGEKHPLWRLLCSLEKRFATKRAPVDPLFWIKHPLRGLSWIYNFSFRLLLESLSR